MAMKMSKRTSGRRHARRAPARIAKLSTRASVRGRKTKAIREIGGMTVREAGRKGGLIGGKKGGETVKRQRGIEFYQKIGRKGGQRVRDLIAAGRRVIERPSRRRHT
jgi:hypothetical protein